MDFFNSVQQVFDPITKPIQHAQDQLTNSMSAASHDMISMTGQVFDDTVEFNQRLVDNFTNAVLAIENGMVTGVESQLSMVEAIGNNPEILPIMIANHSGLTR